jgi:hypothetical protein
MPLVSWHRLGQLFIPAADTWMIVNGTNVVIEPIAEGGQGIGNIISNDYIWEVISGTITCNGIVIATGEMKILISV